MSTLILEREICCSFFIKLFYIYFGCNFSPYALLIKKKNTFTCSLMNLILQEMSGEKKL